MNWPSVDGIFAVPRNPDHNDFELSRLTMLDPETYWGSWLAKDEALVESSVAPVEHHGRAAWRFTAPESKGARPVLTVDQATGILLRAEHPEVGVIEEWTDLSQEVPDDTLFVYTGEWHRSPDFSSRYPTDWEPT